MFNSSFWWCAPTSYVVLQGIFSGSKYHHIHHHLRLKNFFVHVADGGWCPWNPQLSQKEAQKWAVAFLIDWRLLENVFSFPFEELLILEFDMGGGNWNLTFLLSISAIIVKRYFQFNLTYTGWGNPYQNLLIQMTLTLKICIFDPMLVKPKCVFEASIDLRKIVNKQLKNENKWRPAKHLISLLKCDLYLRANYARISPFRYSSCMFFTNEKKRRMGSFRHTAPVWGRKRLTLFFEER